MAKYLNGNVASGDLPYFVTPASAKGSGCFDLLTDDYNMNKMLKAFKTCSSRSITALEYPLPNKETKDTFEVLEYFVSNFMPCSQLSNVKSYGIIIVVIIALIFVLCMVVVVLIIIKRNNLK